MIFAEILPRTADGDVFLHIDQVFPSKVVFLERETHCHNEGRGMSREENLKDPFSGNWNHFHGGILSRGGITYFRFK